MAAIDYFYDSYVRAMAEGSAALFAGAGLSIPSGYVDWSKLLDEIASDLGLDVKKEHDLLSLSQYYVNANRGRHRVNELLVLQLSRAARPNINHELIADLPIRTVWTTNYDTLIEEAFTKNMRKFDKKVTTKDLTI